MAPPGESRTRGIKEEGGFRDFGSKSYPTYFSNSFSGCCRRPTEYALGTSNGESLQLKMKPKMPPDSKKKPLVNDITECHSTLALACEIAIGKFHLKCHCKKTLCNDDANTTWIMPLKNATGNGIQQYYAIVTIQLYKTHGKAIAKFD